MSRARFPGFYKLSVEDRLAAIRQHEWLHDDDVQELLSGDHLLVPELADKMIENVVGVMGLPLGVGLNFVINKRDYLIPLVVEEPSIVAALSSAAKTFSTGGGMTARADESLLIGQVQVVNPSDMEAGERQVLAHKADLLSKLNALHPNMIARGGGAQDIEVRRFPRTSDNPQMLVVHLLVDTCDAMGANMINTMCEEIAPDIEALTGGRVFLRILSNLTDRAVVRASVTVATDQLSGKGYTGEEVRDGIVLASQFANIDPYRAATHNKGIMNGIDPVAIATGNDWRAIEAAAHAYASRGGRYTALTHWQVTQSGDLHGEIEIPLKVGTQGGSLRANPSANIAHRMLGTPNARELAEVMASAGLAQNFSAIRALSTVGIQKGHMSLHARSVALSAGVPQSRFEKVVSRLIEKDDIKIETAHAILAELEEDPVFLDGQTRKHLNEESNSSGKTVVRSFGKVILLGEHAVVYGRPAIAVPIPDAVIAEVMDSDSPPEIHVPAWDIDGQLEHANSIWWSAISGVFDELGVGGERFLVHVQPNIPAAMGLGGSAAIAVAVIRGVDQHFRLGLSDTEVNAMAFRCEKAAHGTPSGIDNTIATFGRPLLYRSGEHPTVDPIHFETPMRLVIGISGEPSLTVDMVAGVRERWRRNHNLYEQLFDNFEMVANTGLAAITDGDYRTLGDMMTVNHGLLNAISVSSPELDRMVQLARDAGSLGAKLTGAGGGGSVACLCDDDEGSANVAGALTRAGYQALQVTV